MDFTYTSEQQSLRETLNRFLDRTYAFESRQELLRSDEPWSHRTWAQLAELGLLALPIDEEHGGIGGTIADVVAVAEVLGEHLTVEPYTATVMLAARTLAAAADDSASGLLDRVVAGQTVVAFAHEEGHGTPTIEHIAARATATETGDAHRVSGQKELVVAAEQSEALLVTARTAGEPGDRDCIAVLLVETGGPGVTTTGYRTQDGRAAAVVRLDDAPAVLLQIADAAQVLDEVLAHATIAYAAEAVGAMDALLRITAEYATTRQQFGVPIGSFQAIGHRLADMRMAGTKARATLLHTTAVAEAGQLTATELSVLKAQVGRCGREIAESAVQIHGGIGTTDELSVGHYMKRILAVEAILGDTQFHLRRIGAAAGVTAG